MVEFNIEKMAAAQKKEGTDRAAAVNKALELINSRGFQNPTQTAELLSTFSPEQFLNFLKDINASVRNIEASNTELFPPDIRVKTQDVSLIRETAVVYPSVDERRRLMELALQKVGALLKSKTSDDQQAAAQILYNAAVYLHPFEDGNGRTARTIYALVSEHVPHDAYPTFLKQTIEGRPSSIDDFHHQLNHSIYYSLLERRGLSVETDAEGRFYNQMLDAKTLGFDGVYLQFIAAFDVLSDDEKKKFNKSTVEGSFSFDEYELPADVTEKIRARMDTIRTEFAEIAIEISQEKWPDWLVEMLDANFVQVKSE